MPVTDPDSPEARRAFRRELRTVSRVLRVTGLAFALIGAVGLLLAAGKGGWWVAPSWFSLAVGAALIVAGVVRRVRRER